MTVRHALIGAAAASLLMIAPATAASADPGSGGCQAFGQGVSTLANTVYPKGKFGKNASTVATSGAGAFPEQIVHPEQDAACP